MTQEEVGESAARVGRPPEEQAAHAAQLAGLAEAFSRLSEERRRRWRVPVSGDPARDTLVMAEAGDWSASYEGVIVDGEQDGDGHWLLDSEFVIFTTDDRPEGTFVAVHGYNCHVEVL